MRISDWSSDVCSSDLSEATQRRLLSGIDEFACHARKLARSRLVFLSQGQIIARSDAERELDTDLSGEIGVRDGKTIFFRRSEEHKSELQSLMRNSYAVFCLKKKTISL